MWDLFEQPWTLVGVAALGFGLDYAVTTDLEKIYGIIKTSMAAAEQEDCAALARLLAADYEDSYHKNKQALVDHCLERLVPPAVEQIRKVAAAVTLTPPQAVVTLTMSVKFEPDSHWARSAGKTGVLVKAQFWLRKQADGRWLVTRIEVLEVDMMAVNWGMA